MVWSKISICREGTVHSSVSEEVWEHEQSYSLLRVLTQRYRDLNMCFIDYRIALDGALRGLNGCLKTSNSCVQPMETIHLLLGTLLPEFDNLTEICNRIEKSAVNT